MAAVTICSDFGAPKNTVWQCFHCFPIYFPWKIQIKAKMKPLHFMVGWLNLKMNFTRMIKIKKTDKCWWRVWVCSVTLSRLTLCDLMGYSPPSSSAHGIILARILEWVAISCSKGSSQPRDQTRVSHIAGRLFIVWATREVEEEVIKPGNAGNL